MREKILDFINKKQRLTASELATRYKVSPQAIHRHLKVLLSEGTILRQGSSRKTTYYIPNTPQALKLHQYISLAETFENEALQEDQIFSRLVEKLPFIKILPANTHRILYYAFTEMMNNAIDHSESKKISMIWKTLGNQIIFEIEDKGIGIFANLQEKKNLSDEMEAIQTLLKGKETTQPEKHSGEGIFFTSKIADSFALESHRKRLSFDNKNSDIFIEDIRNKPGTLVHFEISKNTSKTLDALFRQYTNANFEFEKNETKVSLYRQGEPYISRSQAKRLLHGLSRFKKIVLDFKGLETIGQGFADEVFRVFKSQHPDIEITPLHMHENVEFMVRRALAKI